MSRSISADSTLSAALEKNGDVASLSSLVPRVFTQSLYLYSQQCWAPAAPPGVVLVALIFNFVSSSLSSDIHIGVKD